MWHFFALLDLEKLLQIHISPNVLSTTLSLSFRVLRIVKRSFSSLYFSFKTPPDSSQNRIFRLHRFKSFGCRAQVCFSPKDNFVVYIALRLWLHVILESLHVLSTIRSSEEPTGQFNTSVNSTSRISSVSTRLIRLLLSSSIRLEIWGTRHFENTSCFFFSIFKIYKKKKKKIFTLTIFPNKVFTHVSHLE